MKDESDHRFFNRLVLLVGTSVAAGGCSGGQWFPDADGPPPGDQRLYYSPLNTDPSLHPSPPAGVETDADRAYRREQRNRH